MTCIIDDRGVVACNASEREGEAFFDEVGVLPPAHLDPSMTCTHDGDGSAPGDAISSAILRHTPREETGA
jgi:hypothetical protein